MRAKLLIGADRGTTSIHWCAGARCNFGASQKNKRTEINRAADHAQIDEAGAHPAARIDDSKFRPLPGLFGPSRQCGPSIATLADEAGAPFGRPVTEREARGHGLAISSGITCRGFNRQAC